MPTPPALRQPFASLSPITRHHRKPGVNSHIETLLRREVTTTVLSQHAEIVVPRDGGLLYFHRSLSMGGSGPVTCDGGGVCSTVTRCLISCAYSVLLKILFCFYTTDETCTLHSIDEFNGGHGGHDPPSEPLSSRRNHLTPLECKKTF